MANIKISELNELQKATGQDLLVIVDVANNETKKIQAGNLGTGGAEIPIGPTPPENPKDGDFWIDTSANGETYGDTLPIGAIVEYNGTTVPQGYEKVSDNNIIESGSNANGNWIKYIDGTMICTISKDVSFAGYSQDGAIYFYDINNIDFPQSFTQLNSINASFNSTKPGKFPWVGIYNATTSSIARIRLFNYYNSNDNAGYINIIAIGKWK